jgi:hypothetical protein
VLFTFVRVHGSFAAHSGIEFLDVGRRCFDHRAVRFANASIYDFERLELGRKGVNQYSKLMNGGFGLNPHPEDKIPLALAVWLETDRALNQFIDVRFFAIRLVIGKLRGLGRGSGGKGSSLSLREGSREKVERQKETSQKRNSH